MKRGTGAALGALAGATASVGLQVLAVGEGVRHIFDGPTEGPVDTGQRNARLLLLTGLGAALGAAVGYALAAP